MARTIYERYKDNPFTRQERSSQQLLYCADRYHTTLLLSSEAWAVRVFIALLHYYNLEKGMIVASVPDIQQVVHMSQPRIRYGIAELLEKKIIARHTTINHYYINPAFARPITLSLG